MSIGRTVVFLHGAGGSIKPEAWLDPLNERLSSLGFSRLDPSADRVIAPTYIDCLLSEQRASEPAWTWKRPDDSERFKARMAFTERAEVLARYVRRFEEHSGDVDASWLPDFVATEGIFAEWAINYLEPVRRYQHNERRRWAAQASVIAQLPTHGDIILVAHSLGSVVAVDILPKLPRGLRVDLLLTIGSPLSLKSIGKADPEEFPHDLVGAWINLYDPRDVVTVGRGAGRRHQAAVDIPVRTGTSHDAVAYLSTNAAAAALGFHVYGDRPRSGHVDQSPNQVRTRLHGSWNPLLLSSAYAAQLSAACAGDKWRFKRRLDLARLVVAERTLQNVEGTRQSLASEGGSMGSPVEPGSYPSREQLLHHAADLVRDSWSDEELVSLAVALAMSPPLPPFDLRVDEDHRHRALVNTLNRVRRRSGNISDKQFADAVRAGTRAGQEALKDWDWGFSWGPVLFGTGLVLLALTGVGLAVAAPAGLAGAALVTATLAAFGPGGMVGGIVTIAALTGVGAAATGIGVGSSSADQESATDTVRRIAIEELSTMQLGALRNAVASLLAVVETQRNLGFKSASALVDEALQSALDRVLEERRLHREIAPDRPSTNDFGKRAEVLERGLEWLRKRFSREEPLFGLREAFSAQTQRSSTPNGSEVSTQFKAIDAS